jgi:hypothetical protein
MITPTMGFFLIIGGVIGVTFASFIWSAVREQKARAATLTALGFRDEQRFSLGETKGLDLFDFSNARVYGSAALRDDLAIFDVSYDGGHRHSTAVAFRVPRSVPDFTLRNKPPGAKATTPQMRAQIVIGVGLQYQGFVKPVVDVGREVTVRAFDEAGVRRVLTPAALDALAHLDRLVSVEKGGEWLLYFGDSSRVPADQYPALLDEAQRFVRLLNLA